MFYHQVYAYIQDNEIKDIAVCNNYEVANQISKSIYGSSAIAVDCTYYDVKVGDTYRNGMFYNKETKEPVLYKGNEIENIERIKEKNEQLRKTNIEAMDLIIALTEV